MNFGERLKELRQAKGWTQAQLATASGIPVGTIRDYEQGKRDPLLSNGQKLAKSLGVSLDAFPTVNGPDETPTARGTRPPKALPATPPAGELEQEGKRRHQETPKPPRGRKGT